MLNSHAIYIEKLQPEYKSVFKKISDYVTASNMDEIKNEEMLSEVMDTFLSAQSEGKPVDQVIGGDLKSFCRQLCSDIGIKSRLINFFEAIYPVIVIFTILNILDMFEMFTKLSNGERLNFLIYRGEENLGSYLLGGLIAVVIKYLGRFFIRRLIFIRPDAYKRLVFMIRAVALMLIAGVVIYLFKGTEVEGTYLWVSLFFCGVFLTIYHFITRESRRYKKENRISFYELSSASPDMRNDIEEIEMKRFEKLNRKRDKKGQPELALEQFLEHEKKSCNSWDKRPGFYIFLVIISTVLGLIVTTFFGGFEGFLDMLVFIGVMLAVESVVMYGLFRLINIGTKNRLTWVMTKLKSGSNINPD